MNVGKQEWGKALRSEKMIIKPCSNTPTLTSLFIQEHFWLRGLSVYLPCLDFRLTFVWSEQVSYHPSLKTDSTVVIVGVFQMAMTPLLLLCVSLPFISATVSFEGQEGKQPKTEWDTFQFQETDSSPGQSRGVESFSCQETRPDNLQNPTDHLKKTTRRSHSFLWRKM